MLASLNFFVFLHRNFTRDLFYHFLSTLKQLVSENTHNDAFWASTEQELYFTYGVKLSVCLNKHYAIKAYGWVDAYIHVFLTSEISTLSGELYTPATLPQRKKPKYQLNRTLSESQVRSGRYGEMRILDPTGTRSMTFR
jgi:hypothetical protein